MRREHLAISINGGGALGIGPVALMCEIEKKLGEGWISKNAAAFGGTSTGAIVAACLDEGMSAEKIRKFYRDNLKDIFKKYSLWERIKDLKKPTYNHARLKELLMDCMKGKCSDWEKPIFIPTTRLNGKKSVEKVWDRGDDDVDKWFAVLSSTCAPTYFDAECLEDKEKPGEKTWFCDGGMWANSPIAVLNAGLNITEYRGTYRILTFDTDMDMMEQVEGNQTLLGWGKYVLDEWVARSGKSGDFQVMADIGRENVFVLSPSIPEKKGKKVRYKMDDVTDKTLDALEEIWRNYFQEKKEKIMAFINNT